MLTLKTHYRIALGENNAQHSWIIHSAKGIKWHNVPDELVKLLRRISVERLLDFALGSSGRWYVSHCQNGFDKQEFSTGLRRELGQGPSINLDKLVLGSGSDHWGLELGSSQPFSSVNKDDKFTRLLVSNTNGDTLNDQIDFVSLGFGGSWALSVNDQVAHRCSKTFETQLARGQRARKEISSTVLSPMARVWIIVWKDGTLSHNLPPYIAADVEDYCQLQHSLKSTLFLNATSPRDNQPEPSFSTHQTNNDPPDAASQNIPPRTGLADTKWPTTVPVWASPLIWPDEDDLSEKGSDRGYDHVGVEQGPWDPQDGEAPWKKLSTTLRSLDPFISPDWEEYDQIVRLFRNGWKHRHKRLPTIKRIFVVSLPNDLDECYGDYKDWLELQNGWNGANEQLVFHGTESTCSLGEQEVYNKLCEHTTCSLCCILRTSFLVSKAGSSGRLVLGSILQACHQNDYAKTPALANYKAIIVARVAMGKHSVQYKNAVHFTAPPRGYDSVLGEVGFDLNYDEQVVYKNDAIRPAYVVVYERPMITALPKRAPRPPVRPAPPPTTQPNAKTGISSYLNDCTIM